MTALSNDAQPPHLAQRHRRDDGPALAGVAPGRGATSRPSAAAATPPKRFAALFMGNGINPKHWWAKGAGADMELGKSLEPLAPFRDEAERHHRAVQQVTPPASASTPGRPATSSPGPPLQKGAVLRGGISMDQVLADHFGERDGPAEPGAGLRAADHRLPRDELLDGLQLAHLLAGRQLAGADGGLPVAGLRQPLRQPGQPADARASSTASRTRPPRSSRKVSTADKAKLDEYLTSVREVEKRVERTRRRQGQGRRPGQRPRPARADDAAPDNGLPEDIREHMRLMCDIIALAFQTDKTRVATLLLCRDLSGLFYPFLDVRTAHHPTSHEDDVRRLRARDALLRRPARLPRRAGWPRCRRATRRCWTTRA